MWNIMSYTYVITLHTYIENKCEIKSYDILKSLQFIYGISSHATYNVVCIYNIRMLQSENKKKTVFPSHIFSISTFLPIFIRSFTHAPMAVPANAWKVKNVKTTFVNGFESRMCISGCFTLCACAVIKELHYNSHPTQLPCVISVEYLLMLEWYLCLEKHLRLITISQWLLDNSTFIFFICFFFLI